MKEKTTKFTLISSDLIANERANSKFEFNDFGGIGLNQSPSLRWENVPKNTKSFLIKCHDPDAPTSSGWWHWMVINIPANISDLPTNAGDKNNYLLLLPKGALQISNDFGYKGWGGFLPPIGDKAHKYIFTIYALDIEKLAINENSTCSMVDFSCQGYILDSASFLVFYSR